MRLPASRLRGFVRSDIEIGPDLWCQAQDSNGKKTGRDA